MTSIQHALQKALLIVLQATAAKTATGNGTAVDCVDYEGSAAVVLDSAAAGAGTNPTLDVTLEESDDNSTFTAVPATAFSGGANFTQVTNAASQQLIYMTMSDRKRYIRSKHTIGGTNSPSFTFSCHIVSQKKYQ